MSNKRILYLSYNGLRSHLGQSQILPYLSALNQKGYEFFVISFEEKIKDAPRIHTDFLHWYPFDRGKGHRVFLFIRNFASGIALALYLMLKYRIRLIHARSYIPGAAAVILKRLTPKTKIIFDMRGFMLDEYIEGGVLNPRSPWVRLGRFFEKKIFRNSDAVITLTHRSAPLLKQSHWMGERKISITVIPCCKPLVESEIRKNGHWDGAERKEIRLIYACSLGSWYDFPRMLSFFESFQRKFPDSTLNVLSPQADAVRNIVEKSRLREKIKLAAVPFSEVHRYLAIADIGLLFYQPGFSRIGTSPIKFPEYLWAGLAVAATPNIGDLDNLVTKYKVGVILDSSDEEAAERIVTLLKDPQLAQRCRWVAKEFYNIQGGIQRYEEVYQGALEPKF